MMRMDTSSIRAVRRVKHLLRRAQQSARASDFDFFEPRERAQDAREMVASASPRNAHDGDFSARGERLDAARGQAEFLCQFLNG